MKREHKNCEKYEHGVFKHFSVFTYHQCVKCKKDFRFEKGWTFLSGPFFNNQGNRKYICSSCAKSEEVAHKVAIEYTNGKPNTPPSAPRTPDKKSASSRMTISELLVLMELNEIKFDDPLMSVKFYGDGSGFVEINNYQYDFDDIDGCIEIINKHPYDL